MSGTLRYIDEYKQVHENLKLSCSKSRTDQREQWKAPSHGWVKTNWDVATDYSSCRMGIGVIIRDEHGTVVAAWSKTCQGSVEPTTGEAIALFHAASLCRDLGFHEVIFEGDAQTGGGCR
jgi:hypothetical protein